MKLTVFAILTCGSVVLGGCATMPGTAEAVLASPGAVPSRQMQERAFDTADRERMLRAVLGTLQGMGFIVDKADATLGFITATKLEQYTLRATVTVRPQGAKQMLVRVSAQYALPGQPGGARPIEQPEAYQDFFAALSKSIFLASPAAKLRGANLPRLIWPDRRGDRRDASPPNSLPEGGVRWSRKSLPERDPLGGETTQVRISGHDSLPHSRHPARHPRRQRRGHCRLTA